MSWRVRRDRDGITEWERSDGLASIRKRERADGAGYVVRIDRLEQAPEGRTYRRESVADAAAADALVDEWQETFERSAE
ncbi:DUF7543 family protein [Halopenitus persicus]|uniref:Uncharacterized protein n=1 Tax=Halopenitus persicus TaxID=1048396 RepID=A0A1H3JPJ6_9EURY|nr:hypothetical protein [Halopenitus persicus]QHS15802.1 hypothetical protein GWK26_00820 [haloarchaeon 3A1-DGR]SDY41519.1 hypothetical protein SAMN05216564_10585 [Halopenitus persicus]